MSGPWIAAFVAFAALNLFTVVVVLGVLRRVLPVLERVGASVVPPGPGPRAGSPLPAFEGLAADGRTVTSGELADGLAVLLFVERGCESCHRLLAELRRVGVRPGTARLYLVAGEGTDLGELPPGLHAELLRQRGDAVSAALGVDALPSAAAVKDGVILDWQVLGSAEQLQRLIDRAHTADTPAASPA